MVVYLALFMTLNPEISDSIARLAPRFPVISVIPAIAFQFPPKNDISEVPCRMNMPSIWL
jgi:hypothetical protein